MLSFLIAGTLASVPIPDVGAEHRDPLLLLRGADTVIALPPTAVPLQALLQHMADQSGFEVEIRDTVDGNAEVSFREEAAPCDRVLVDLAEEYDLYYRVPRARTLVVGQWSTASRRPLVSSRDHGGVVPSFLRQPMPAYPPEARRLYREARILIEFSVDKAGRAHPIRQLECFLNDPYYGPVKSSQKRCAPFREAAFGAIREWQMYQTDEGYAEADYIANIPFKVERLLESPS